MLAREINDKNQKKNRLSEACMDLKSTIWHVMNTRVDPDH